MSSSKRPHVIAIVGPTGVGKTTVGEQLALRMGGEVVSADSMQVYRGLDIGTAKLPASERRVPHHCIDLVDPGTPYSAALFQRDARAAIDSIAAAGHVPLMVGGTGLYIRAALDEMNFPAGHSSSPVRENLQAFLDREGPEALYALLQERDADAAALIHRNNSRRVLRALEMLETDETSYVHAAEHFAERVPFYPATFIGLMAERDLLYRRIDARVDAMIAGGLLDEVRGLLDAGYRSSLTAAQAIGYKELVPVIDGNGDLDSAVAAIKQASRRYAKRQMTWFRADPRVRWLDVTDLSPAAATDAAFALVESEAAPRS
ncbi:MAG TPA: tRNA (adenosine(37)-N6)-dimethylallyltransferase MiaA [Coriobacteriia bacterium]